MAERRMFAKTVIDSDAFLDMPLSTQALYFHLSMRADDDGFVNNPRKILRMIGASEDDFKVLLAKNFLIPFENGIVVIKHWKIHNYIQSDRYKETVYREEKAMLSIKDNKAYTLKKPLDTECIQDGYTTDTQVRLGKDSIGKDSIGKGNRRLTPPTLEEVTAYCKERGNKVDPQRFIDYYQSQSWKKANGRPVTDWKACVRTWEQKDKKTKLEDRHDYDYDEIERKLFGDD
ncbi:MAG: replisome organizer [Bacteroidales bacterium]|nr:replisome organizer [Bacteroidales bacterium]